MILIHLIYYNKKKCKIYYHFITGIIFYKIVYDAFAAEFIQPTPTSNKSEKTFFKIPSLHKNVYSIRPRKSVFEFSSR